MSIINEIKNNQTGISSIIYQNESGFRTVNHFEI